MRDRRSVVTGELEQLPELLHDSGSSLGGWPFDLESLDDSAVRAFNPGYGNAHTRVRSAASHLRTPSKHVFADELEAIPPSGRSNSNGECGYELLRVFTLEHALGWVVMKKASVNPGRP
jgi:hypothetical protein